jgi:hypothetical protein
MHVAKEPSLALSNQSWRTFLSIDNTSLENLKEETKAAHCCKEVLDILLPNPDMYPRLEKWSSLMGPIVWQGRECYVSPPTADITSRVEDIFHFSLTRFVERFTICFTPSFACRFTCCFTSSLTLPFCFIQQHLYFCFTLFFTLDYDMCFIYIFNIGQ